MHIGIPNPHCRYTAIIDEKELKEVKQHEDLSHLIIIIISLTYNYGQDYSKETNMILYSFDKEIFTFLNQSSVVLLYKHFVVTLYGV